MPTVELTPLTGRYLSFSEREEIAVHRAQGLGVREIARRIGREIRQLSHVDFVGTRQRVTADFEYRASVAQWKADLVARRPKIAKLVANERLHDYVQDRLSGRIITCRRRDPWP